MIKDERKNKMSELSMLAVYYIHTLLCILTLITQMNFWLALIETVIQIIESSIFFFFSSSTNFLRGVALTHSFLYSLIRPSVFLAALDRSVPKPVKIMHHTSAFQPRCNYTD